MINPNQRKITLPARKIAQICRLWGDFKYVRVFKVIAKNPSIKTHEIMRKAFVNNVPDQAIHINKHLEPLGLMVACVRDKENLGKREHSHAWYLVTIGTECDIGKLEENKAIKVSKSGNK